MKSAKLQPTSQCFVTTQTGLNTAQVLVNSSQKICPQIFAHTFSFHSPMSNRAVPDGDFVHSNGTIKMKAGWTVFTLEPMHWKDQTLTWKFCWLLVAGTTETPHFPIWLLLKQEHVQIRLARTKVRSSWFAYRSKSGAESPSNVPRFKLKLVNMVILMYIFYAFLFISPLKDFIKLLQKIIFRRSCW